MPRSRVGFASSNREKYAWVRRMLRGTPGVALRWLPPKECLDEGDNGAANAVAKALRASVVTTDLVLASDEELRFVGEVPGDIQPGARVRRIVGEDAKDQAVVNYYEELIGTLPTDVRKGQVRVHFALARHGSLLRSIVWTETVRFRLPRAARWLNGRPLSAFHYLPRFRKYYSELTRLERDEVDARRGAKLRRVLERVIARQR